MIRKFLDCLLATLLLTVFSPAEAQQAKNKRIGFLGGDRVDKYREAFQRGLRDQGYVEGKNYVLEYRYAEGRTGQIPDLVAELVRLQVDVIVTGVTLAAQAAKKSTTTIPIVVVGVGNPVGTGLVASLARPGGSITGLSGLAPELSGKRLELLKETFPKVSRVGVFWNPASPSNVLNWKETEAAARPASLHLQSLAVKSPKDFNSAFATALKGHVNALVIIRDNVTNSGRELIIAFSVKQKLPSIYPAAEYAEDGGLMSYAPDFTAMYHRAAYYVDKILQGTKPADLPVEQPRKFELVINLNTAKQIRLTIPPNVLVRADRVIR